MAIQTINRKINKYVNFLLDHDPSPRIICLRGVFLCTSEDLAKLR